MTWFELPWVGKMHDSFDDNNNNHNINNKKNKNNIKSSYDRNGTHF